MPIRTIIQLICILCLSTGVFAQTKAADLRVVATQSLEGDTKWDYLSFEPGSHHLFITHGDRVDVFDTREKRVSGVGARSDFPSLTE